MTELDAVKSDQLSSYYIHAYRVYAPCREQSRAEQSKAVQIQHMILNSIIYPDENHSPLRTFAVHRTWVIP